MKINRVKDFLERVGWTAIQAGIGAALDELTSGHITWRAILYAALAAALKVVAAQNLGKHPDGAAIPGGIIKTPKR